MYNYLELYKTGWVHLRNMSLDLCVSSYGVILHTQRLSTLHTTNNWVFFFVFLFVGSQNADSLKLWTFNGVPWMSKQLSNGLLLRFSIFNLFRWCDSRLPTSKRKVVSLVATLMFHMTLVKVPCSVYKYFRFLSAIPT